MDFDFDRYSKRRFHKDDEVNNKVKALFLYYDYQVVTNKLNPSQQLTLLDDWISKFESHELYEVIPMFEMRRTIVIKQIIRDEDEKVTFIEYVSPNLNKRWEKLKLFFKNIFKRK